MDQLLNSSQSLYDLLDDEDDILVEHQRLNATPSTAAPPMFGFGLEGLGVVDPPVVHESTQSSLAKADSPPPPPPPSTSTSPPPLPSHNTTAAALASVFAAAGAPTDREMELIGVVRSLDHRVTALEEEMAAWRKTHLSTPTADNHQPPHGHGHGHGHAGDRSSPTTMGTPSVDSGGDGGDWSTKRVYPRSALETLRTEGMKCGSVTRPVALDTYFPRKVRATLPFSPCPLGGTDGNLLIDLDVCSLYM